jgi:hypothetical protein
MRNHYAAHAASSPPWSHCFQLVSLESIPPHFRRGQDARGAGQKPPTRELLAELRAVSATIGAEVAAALRCDSDFRPAGHEQLPDDIRLLLVELACSFQLIAGTATVAKLAAAPLLTPELLHHCYETAGVYSWLTAQQA